MSEDLRFLGFISYKKHEGFERYRKFLERLRARLHEELTLSSRFPISLFMDADLEKGQRFEAEIRRYLKSSHFLFPVITPAYFNSEFCLREYEQFQEREHELRRSDLIFPLLLTVNTMDLQQFRDGFEPRAQKVVDDLLSRQHSDWTSLWAEAWDSQHDAEINKLVNPVCRAAGGLYAVRNTIVLLPAADPDSDRSESAVATEEQERISQILNELSGLNAQYSNVRAYRAGVIRETLEIARDEVRRLVDPHHPYRQDLSLDFNFILRAGPVFRRAAEIHAVSLDELSGFWKSGSQYVRDYIDLQPKNTKRLFVFSTELSMLEYRNILATHNQQYGRAAEGAVLFCNRANWLHWARSIGGESVFNELKEKDFAILRFGEFVDAELFEATLSKRALIFEPLNKFRGIYGDLKKQFSAVADRVDTAGRFFRWRDEYAVDDEAWFDVVNRTFGKDPARRKLVKEGAFYHFIFFTEEASKDRRGFTERLARDLALIFRTANNKLWVGETEDSILGSVEDGCYHGRLQLDNSFRRNYPVCAVMQFDSEEDLRDFYESPVHSKVREAIFRRFGEFFRDRYDRISSQSMTEEVRALLYETIEFEAQKLFIRADFREPRTMGSYRDVKPVDVPETSAVIAVPIAKARSTA